MVSLDDYRALMLIVTKIKRKQGMPDKYTGKVILQVQDGIVRGVGFDCATAIDFDVIRQFQGKS